MIARRLDGKLSAAELAAESRLSIAEFNQAFEKTVGARPDIWLAERRVEAAMHLLRHSDGPIDDIAVASGFHDWRHLRRVFLRTIDVGPDERRKSVRH